MQNHFNQQIIDEFRANGGRVGGPFENARLILLTTVGARSGAPHTTPLGYLPDGGERILVIASAGGAPNDPDWFRNLVANPRVRVEDGVFGYDAEAVVLEGAERDRAFARAAEADPGWAGYQAKAARVIPVVALRQVADGPPPVTGSPGAGLKLLHDAFRRELALIRKEVAEGGAGLGAQLRINCLTLCGGLRHHHTTEDAGVFPFLAGRHPDLAPALDRLHQEHQKVAVLLDELREAVSADRADPQVVLRNVDRLTGELESHLRHEEEQLISVLDAMVP